MSDVQKDLVAALNRAATQLRTAGLPGELATRWEELAGQVHDPCVVAVVGRVKVGKSTFVNALLGGDHAKVGTTETTATINYFFYGEPGRLLGPERPVRCHWRGGKITDESRGFLDALQGYSLETLRRADGIDYLEYFLPEPFLKQITLVDTPGTGAVVGEHQDRTAEFLGLNEQLRERHDRETRRLNEAADAIVYLVGPVAGVSDEAFLEEFAQVADAPSALNAIGVLSKIELNPKVMARRHELSTKIAGQFKESLNTVIPVAAGLRREMDQLLENDRSGLDRMIATLRRIPPASLEVLLDSEELFCNLEPDDCPVDASERRELLGEMKWGVFTTLARVAADPALTPDQVAERLDETSGFGPLWQVLNERFIQRGHILRCYRILRDAWEVLEELKFTHLPQRRREFREGKDRLERFLDLVSSAREKDLATARELEDFLRRRLGVGERVRELENLHDELNFELSTLSSILEEYNADFECLQELRDKDYGFSSDELEELRALLGLYGGGVEKRLPPGRAADAEYIGQRQRHWQARRMEVPYGSGRYVVADRAYTRYGIILDEIWDHGRSEPPEGYK